MSQTSEHTSSKLRQIRLVSKNVKQIDGVYHQTDLQKNNSDSRRSLLECRTQSRNTTDSQPLNLKHSGTCFDVGNDLSTVLNFSTVHNTRSEKPTRTNLLELINKLNCAQEHLQILVDENEKLRGELLRTLKISMTDELTGLSNRRAYLNRLEDEISRLKREHHPLAIALIDLDRFKLVNDTYGHAAGDEVLRTFCSKILPALRHHDMLARYGGEEFAIILPNTDHHGAKHALMKVKEFAENIVVNYIGAKIPLNTFSAGITTYQSGDTVKNIISRADDALYRAKRLGRNRIEIEMV